MLAFLHTAELHVATFTRLAHQIAPSVGTRHEVREDLLTQALTEGRVSAGTQQAVQEQVRLLIAAGARVVVCTCSTLGDAAVQTPNIPGNRVLRIDRPMAMRGARSGRPVLVVAATPTAMATALALLAEEALAVNANPVIRQLLCVQAWERFQAGDHAGYAAAIAEQVLQHALPNDMVMLAQASMAAAASLIVRADLEVLTSPETGVQAAMSAHQAVRLP